MTEAYPLQWPDGWPRTPTWKRKRAQFGKSVQKPGYSWQTKESLTVADARRRLQDEVDRLGGRNAVLSTNVELRMDGMPRSGQREPDDPGVAVYFTLSGKPHCMPCDRWDRVADNIAAIAKHIEATRGIARWGVADTDQLFRGFQALPPPSATLTGWREVLGPFVDTHGHIQERHIEERYRALAKKYHPDAPGGSDQKMAEINLAREQALAELRRTA